MRFHSVAQAPAAATPAPRMTRPEAAAAAALSPEEKTKYEMAILAARR